LVIDLSQTLHLKFGISYHIRYSDLEAQLLVTYLGNLL